MAAPTPPHLLSRLDTVITTSPMLPLDHTSVLTPPTTPSPGKKPRLSLKTSDLAPSFHASTTRRPVGANVDTTATPTTFNTFNNTFDLSFRPSPVLTIPSSPGSSTSQRRLSTHPTSPIAKSSSQPQQPYTLSNLPFGVQSILKNGPLPREIRSAISASPRAVGARRMFFPAPKKVSFRPTPELEDEIVTRKYTVSHADLSSSSSSEAEDEDDPAQSESDEQETHAEEDDDTESTDSRVIRVDELPGRGRRKRKVRAEGTEVGPRRESGTLVSRSGLSAFRTKRKRRRWEWTIDPSKSLKADKSGQVSEDGVTAGEELVEVAEP